jgi:ABC-2 type transport system permease protein
LFPLEGLPPFLEIIAKADPLSYGVDGLRGVLVSKSHFGIGPDFLILSIITAIILLIGSYLFSKIEI